MSKMKNHLLDIQEKIAYNIAYGKLSEGINYAKKDEKDKKENKDKGKKRSYERPFDKPFVQT